MTFKVFDFQLIFFSSTLKVVNNSTKETVMDFNAPLVSLLFQVDSSLQKGYEVMKNRKTYAFMVVNEGQVHYLRH